ncbi:hypothetical protein VNO78_24776 [Psophocarpus tetragonolobus]|uniref:Peptidase M20 dimerisation domain-containing protein n=1 Tax=Psophocarpus tetragonolobus TaxID=3891 RepID=A0AAN9S8I5_PSOTE
MCSFKWFPLFMILHVVAATPIFSLTDSSNTNFLDIAKTAEVFEWMVKIRREIHKNPELSFQEYNTSTLIREKLDELDIPHNKHPIGKDVETAVLGYIGTGNPPFVAIRADMDALPIQEMVESDYKSKNPGKMHACGHDAHVTMVLGAAKMLKQHEKDIQGTVVLVFQPAEEGGGGAKKVLETGALQNISAIFGLHVAPPIPVGAVATRDGTVLAGSGQFEANITGKGGHAAIPQLSIDPIVAASNVVVSLQYLVSRESDPLEPQVVTVGKFQGGDAFNVIPDYVTIGGTFRAITREGLNHLKQRIKEVIIDQAAVQRCSASVTMFEEDNRIYPPTINDESLHEFFLEVAGNVIGRENVILDEPPSMGSEDFAFYQEVLPGYFFLLGVETDSPNAASHSLHSPYLQINESALPYGAALHASLATSYLIKYHQGIVGKLHDEL